MTDATVKTDYNIQTLQSDHMKNVINLFVKCFCDSEPITKHLGLQYQDYEPFAKEVIQKAVKEGMSKVILNKDNQIIACAIAEDISDPFIPHIAHYPKLKPVISLIDLLSQPFLEGKKYNKGKVAHIWISAVDPTYRGQGLSTIVDMACVEAAARKGYDFAYAEFTNDISEKVTEQFKILKKVNEIDLNEFTMEDNKKPFQGLNGNVSAYLATIRPGVNLDSIHNCYQKTEQS